MQVPNAQGRVVLVKNVSGLVEESHIKELFACCGKIEDINSRTVVGGTKEVEITFSKSDEAAAAQALTGTTLGDTAFEVVVTTREQLQIINRLRLLQNKAAANNLTLQQNGGVPPPGGLPGMPIPVQQSNGSMGIALSQAGILPGTPQAMKLAAQRQDEVSRTVYVGNLHPDLTEEQLKMFFSSCGNVTACKHGKVLGEGTPQATRFAFVEFATRQGAETAMTLAGTHLGDRPIKVGQANNPIMKPPPKSMVASTANKDMDAIMQRVKMASQRISKKVEGPGENAAGAEATASDKPAGGDAARGGRDGTNGGDRRSRDRGRRRRDRSRSRDRGRRRRHRSRSRDRGRRRRRDRSRSRSRSPKKRYLSPVSRKKHDPHEGMFFNGWKWIPVEEATAPQPEVGGPVEGIIINNTLSGGLQHSTMLALEAAKKKARDEELASKRAAEAADMGV